MGGKIYEGKLKVEGGNSAEVANARKGEITPATFEVQDGNLVVDIRLRPYDGFCYIIK